MKPTPQELEAIAELQNIPVNIEIDGLMTFMLISQLQLALRHPSNRGGTSEDIRQFTVQLQNQLAKRSPAIKSILEKGWHPEFDVSENDQ